MIKYRVHFTESERGWGQNRYYRDYDTRDEAVQAFNGTNAQNVSATAPDYYIIAERIEVVDTQLLLG